jgi:hypothetical protein
MSGVGGHTWRDRSCKWRRSRKRDVDELYEYQVSMNQLTCIQSLAGQNPKLRCIIIPLENINKMQLHMQSIFYTHIISI